MQAVPLEARVAQPKWLVFLFLRYHLPQALFDKRAQGCFLAIGNLPRLAKQGIRDFERGLHECPYRWLGEYGYPYSILGAAQQRFARMSRTERRRPSIHLLPILRHQIEELRDFTVEEIHIGRKCPAG